MSARRKKIQCHVDFECLVPDCKAPVAFNLLDAVEEDKQILCPSCHHPYEFEDTLKNKLSRLLKLMLAVREAESILGDCNVSVNVPAGNVKIPYRLLLTRLNTLICLNIQGKNTNFHFRIEPSSPDTFK